MVSAPQRCTSKSWQPSGRGDNLSTKSSSDSSNDHGRAKYSAIEAAQAMTPKDNDIFIQAAKIYEQIIKADTEDKAG